MTKERGTKRQWVYRPTESEHELILKAIARSGEYSSIAQFVREATMRLIYDNDQRTLFTEIATLIDDLKETKDKFLDLILRNSEETF